jgi:hypothetical protein
MVVSRSAFTETHILRGLIVGLTLVIALLGAAGAVAV